MLTIENIFKSFEEMQYKLATESRLVRVGLKEKQDMESIMKEYQWLANDDVLAFVKEKITHAETADEKEILDRLYYEILSVNIYNTMVAETDEFQTWISQKKVTVDEKDVYYYGLQNLIKKEPNFDKREELLKKMQIVHTEGNPKIIHLLKKELNLIHDKFKFKDYIDYCQQKKQINYKELHSQISPIIEKTQSLFEDHISNFVKHKLNHPFGNLSRCHAQYLFDYTQFDTIFSKNRLMSSMETTINQMGIDFQENKNIHLDLENRERKNPRASCYPAKSPEEIHLIITPAGGLYDYEAFFHESGHALHYSNANANLHYAFRHMNRSNAHTEIYSFLIEKILCNPLWHEKILGQDAKTSKQIVYYLILNDLYTIRKYIALFTSELLFFEQNDLLNGNIYARELTRVTQFVYRDTDYLFDMDSGFYSADYLRAWIAEAQLSSYLENNFGNDWFINKKAGNFLKQLWLNGDKYDAEVIIENLGMKKFDITFLLNRFEKLKSYQQFI